MLIPKSNLTPTFAPGLHHYNNHNAVKILYFASRKIQNFATECLAIVDCGSISGNTFQSTTYMLWPKFSSSLFAEQNFFFRSKNMYSTVQFCEIRVLFIFLAKIASIPVGKKLENLGQKSTLRFTHSRPVLHTKSWP